MVICIGLLRAVNLAAHNQVGMAALCGVIERAGLKGVRSVLQSGNVVFASSSRSTASLELKLEQALEAQLGLKTAVFVRTAAEWNELIDANPFKTDAKRDPGHLLVVLLKSAADKTKTTNLRSAIVGRERVEVNGRVAYITYPDGIGRSRLTTALIEKHLGTRVTGRNWNTVMKLAALAAAGE